MSVCRGWASCGAAYSKTSVQPLPCDSSVAILGKSPPSPYRSPYSKRQNTPLDLLVLCVAGCATSSICPKRPSLRRTEFSASTCSLFCFFYHYTWYLVFVYSANALFFTKVY